MTVCGVAVSAGLVTVKELVYNGFLMSPVDLFQFTKDDNIIYPFNGYFSSTFSIDSMNDYGILKIVGDSLGLMKGYRYGTNAGYIEIVFNILEPVQLHSTDDSGAFSFKLVNPSGGEMTLSHPVKCDFFYDDTIVNLTCGDSGVFFMIEGDWAVSRYFGWRFYYDDYSASWTISSADSFSPQLQLYCNSVFSSLGEFSGVSQILSSINVTNGLLDSINDNISDVRNIVTVMDTNLAEIRDTVVDTNQQLQDENSSIWSAFGNKVSSTLESLFVPSQQDIEDVKTGFDELAKDKLGGAYTAMETVEDTVSDISMKLNNPSASEGIEFPGISVPLGGDVGTVTLAEAQTVTLPTEMTAILHPVAGTIISLVCGLGTFNVLKDMVECFLSGFSYAGYLYRNKGRSDE